jgi:putative transcriptional regulator
MGTIQHFTSKGTNAHREKTPENDRGPVLAGGTWYTFTMDRAFNDQLAPGFLVAPPSLPDPNFADAVVVLAVHEDEGSMGFIINRHTELTLFEVLSELDIDPSVRDRKVLLGGPVSTYSGFLLYEHPADAPMVSGLFFSPTLSISPSRELLEEAAKGNLPGHFDLILGYAGWGPEQLEAELHRGGWLHTEFDQELFFEVPLDERWAEAYQRLGVSPLGFMTVPGGAQA